MRCPALLLVPLATILPATAQIDDPIRYLTTRQQAFAAMRASDWSTAARDFESLSAKYPWDPAVWQGLGTARLQLRRSLPAKRAFERALALGGTFPENLCFDIARCCAQVEQNDEAFAWLRRAIADRFESRPFVARERDFAGLHVDARWREIVPTVDEGIDRVAGWRADLTHLAAEIERLHQPTRDSAALADVRAAIDSLAEQVESLRDEQVLARMQRTVRMLSTGHSVVYPVATRFPITELPLRFYWFGDDLHVIAADDEHQHLVGARVERIGRGRSADFERDLQPIVSRDNATGVRWFGPKYLRMTPYLLDLGYVDAIDKVRVVLRDRADTRVEVELAPQPVALQNPRLVPPTTAEPPRFLRRTSEHYWQQELDSSTHYVQINQMRNQGAQSLPDFALAIRAQLRESSCRDLIVDLRHNNGGDPQLARELLRTLVWFETSRPNAHVWLVIGRMTFSAAQNFANDVERLCNATFVGERSGSRPNMVGETTEVVLPWSGVQLSIGCRRYQDSFPGDERRWIAPHMPVPLTAVDYFAGRDPVMTAIEKAIRIRRGR